MKEKIRIAHFRNVLQRLLPKAKEWAGIVYRSTSSKYANNKDLLAGIGSQFAGGRWNPKGSFPTVYLSLELETAFHESFAHFSYYGFKPYEALPRTFLAVSLRLQRVLDISNPNHLKRLRLTRSTILNLDWRKIQDAGGIALTQALGKLACELGYEGILVPSFPAQGGRNLVIFPKNLLAESQMSILNPENPLPNNEY